MLNAREHLLPQFLKLWKLWQVLLKTIAFSLTCSIQPCAFKCIIILVQVWHKSFICICLSYLNSGRKTLPLPLVKKTVLSLTIFSFSERTLQVCVRVAKVKLKWTSWSWEIICLPGQLCLWGSGCPHHRAVPGSCWHSSSERWRRSSCLMRDLFQVPEPWGKLKRWKAMAWWKIWDAVLDTSLLLQRELHLVFEIPVLGSNSLFSVEGKMPADVIKFVPKGEEPQGWHLKYWDLANPVTVE